jgi:hypothetical protein
VITTRAPLKASRRKSELELTFVHRVNNYAICTSGREAIYTYVLERQRYRVKKYSRKGEPGLFVGRAVAQIGEVRSFPVVKIWKNPPAKPGSNCFGNRGGLALIRLETAALE